MLKVRRILTEILLEVTENQVQIIAKEELRRAKSGISVLCFNMIEIKFGSHVNPSFLLLMRTYFFLFFFKYCVSFIYCEIVLETV